MTGLDRGPAQARGAEDVRHGRRASEQVVSACLERIRVRDPVVRAWTHVDSEVALGQARARDAAVPGGPLHGVPVGVKDIIDTADLPTENGSPIYVGNRPEADATCVRRLRDAGAVVLGKTVTTEFALFTPGPTTNPHDPARTPGGSSSGSAAAVADGMVPVALGTQTAGSIVRPASYCGVFGFKPTFGSVPTDGVKQVSASLDTVGALARDVELLARCVGVMAGDLDRFVPVAPPARPRVGFARSHDWHRVDPDARARIEAAIERVAARSQLTDVALPGDFGGLVEAQVAVMTVEASTALAPERRDHPDRLSQRLRDVLDDGARRTWQYDAALRLAQRCRDQLDELLRDVDLLVTPSVDGEAPEGLDSTGDPLLCRAWTLLGSPTVSVPGLTGAHGLPLGVQVVGRHGRDGATLGAARWLAEALA